MWKQRAPYIKVKLEKTMQKGLDPHQTNCLNKSFHDDLSKNIIQSEICGFIEEDHNPGNHIYFLNHKRIL